MSNERTISSLRKVKARWNWRSK